MINLLPVLVTATLAAVQVGGGSAVFGQQRQSAGDAARANELAKRNIGRDDAGRFLDAAVLLNLNADEYVAVFAVSREGKTLDEAQRSMAESVLKFTEGLRQLKTAPSDIFVDFISQNRIYGFEGAGENVVREIVVGFEVKKNISVRYTDKALLDRLMATASTAGIFDLVKVDYIVRDQAGVRTRLLEEAGKILRRKAEEQERFLGVKVGQISHAYPAQFSTYYPTEMYDSYTAQESEEIYGYRQNQVVQRARKPRTFYFNGLTGKDFDHVINPVITEPTVQCTVYVRVRY